MRDCGMSASERMWPRSHRHGRSMSVLSAQASIWKYSRRSGSVYRSHCEKTTVQNAWSVIVFGAGVSGVALGRVLPGARCAWISSRNQSGYS